MNSPRHDVTQILAEIRQGKREVTNRLLPLVYEELRKLAAARLANEPIGQTLQSTALVHEAYLRLLGDPAQTWEHRGHFFAAAAEAMRRILVENARRKQRLRHGGQFERVDVDPDLVASPVDSKWDLLALEAALIDFEREHPRKAELVKLRYFAGLEESEAAEVLGISRATASRDWSFAKAWLFSRIGK